MKTKVRAIVKAALAALAIAIVPATLAAAAPAGLPAEAAAGEARQGPLVSEQSLHEWRRRLHRDIRAEIAWQANSDLKERTKLQERERLPADQWLAPPPALPLRPVLFSSAVADRPALADVVPQLVEERPDDMHALIWPTDTHPVSVLLRRTAALLKRLQMMSNAPASLTAHARELAQLSEEARTKGDDPDLFTRIAALRRRIALCNPLLDFDALVFCGQRPADPIFHHPVRRYHWDARNGLYMVEGLKTGTPRVRDLLQDAKVENGRFEGETLSNKNPRWGGLAMVGWASLDYDARRVVFGWAVPKDIKKQWEMWPVNLFIMNLDGTGLRQLTDEEQWDNYGPVFLPNGRIVFISDRRNCQERCGGTRPGGTLHSMNPDGSDVLTLSWHETNEVAPAVDNAGRIVYTRWDYVDRSFFAGHALWTCGPDGSDPRAPRNNYRLYDAGTEPARRVPKPHPLATVPLVESGIKAIPGTFGRYVAIESGHHGSHFGNLILIDLNQPPGSADQCRLLWPGMMLSGDGGFHDTRMHPHSQAQPANVAWRRPGVLSDDQLAAIRAQHRSFRDPWPLDADFHLVCEFDQIVLVDKYKNEDVLVDTDQWIGPTLFARWAQPVRPRSRPPEIPTRTFQGERRKSPEMPKATLAVMNVYDADFQWPADTKITALRIVQVLPKPKWPYDKGEGTPRTEHWSQGIGRAVLGTVPVEDDGSAYFLAPIEREIYFQALDANGMAVKSMQSGTYVHPGEQLACQGCHEDRTKAPAVQGVPKALRRPPSPIQPDVVGSNPMSYYRLVKHPVFDKKCAGCHQEKQKGPHFEYWEKPFDKPGPLAKYLGTNRQSRTLPLKFGAHASALVKYLGPSHYDVQLTKEELYRVVLWLDLYSPERGDFDPTPESYKRVVAGEVVVPVHPAGEYDLQNPTGVQQDGREPWRGSIEPRRRSIESQRTASHP